MAEGSPTEILYWYADADKKWAQQLKNHLKPLIQKKLITVWDAGDIPAGTDCSEAINSHLESASIILLLVSPDLFASKLFEDENIHRMQKQKQLRGTIIIPIILRPCRWDGTFLKDTLAIPRNNVAITKQKNKDEAFEEVINELHTLLASQPEFNQMQTKSISHSSISSNEKENFPAKEPSPVENIEEDATSLQERSSALKPPASPIKNTTEDATPLQEPTHQSSILPRQATIHHPINRRSALYRFFAILAIAAIIIFSLLIYFSTHPEGKVLTTSTPLSVNKNKVTPTQPTLIVQTTPTQTPLPTPAPTSQLTQTQPIVTPQPMPSPTPTSTNALYTASWASGADNWQLSDNCPIENGMIVCNGKSPNDLLIAPATLSTSDYAIEATIKLSGFTDATQGRAFGLIARNNANQGGYIAGVGYHTTPEHFFIGLLQNDPSINNEDIRNDLLPDINLDSGIDTNWHTYKFEVTGNTLKLFFDGNQIESRSNPSFTQAGKVGIYVNSAQIDIKDFAIYPL